MSTVAVDGRVSDHQSERIRDVPASCMCRWNWSRYQIRWLRTRPNYDCPWHTPRRKP